MNFGKYALLALAGVSLLAFTSCKKDDKAKNPPKFVVNDKDGKNITAELTSRTVFPLEIRVTPGDGLKITELTYSVTYDPAAGENKGKIDDLKKVDSHFQGHFAEAKIPADKTKGVITFKAVDSEKGENTISVKFNFGGTTPGGNDNPPAETGWGAQKDGAVNHVNGRKEGAFDLKNGKPVSVETGKQADFYMINTSTGKETDFVAGWSSDKVTSVDKTGNGTKFAKVTVDYDKVTVADAKTAFNAASPSTTVSDVVVGNIYVAVKDAEVYILKITKVDKEENSTRKKGRGCIEFSYKAKK